MLTHFNTYPRFSMFAVANKYNMYSVYNSCFSTKTKLFIFKTGQVIPIFDVTLYTLQDKHGGLQV